MLCQLDNLETQMTKSRMNITGESEIIRYMYSCIYMQLLRKTAKTQYRESNTGPTRHKLGK